MKVRTAASLLSAIALTACAPLHWQKAGADEAATTEDLSACRRLAHLQTVRGGNLGLPPSFDPRFGAPIGPTQAEQRMQESQHADACMRAKGYALVPVGK
jgi:hypothetical protein